MADENQNDNPIDPATVFVKRKRGRPRKDVVPGSESVRRRPYRRAEHSVQFGDISVGQTVSGVLDGKFDAGYMITVKAGSSGTVLTGVVFEQGRSVPISPANDVAPNVEMLKRVEVPIPNSRCQGQSIPKRDNVVMRSMESSIRPMPEDLNLKHPPDPSSVSNNASEAIVHSGLTLTTPSSVSIHGIDSWTQINQNELSAPKPLISEPTEIKATVTPDKEFVHSEGTTKISPIDTLPLASEPTNMSSLTLTTPSSVSIQGFDGQTQINQNAVSAPEPSVSEPTEIKATVTSDKELVQSEGTIKNSAMDTLPSASEPMNTRSLTLTTLSSVSIHDFDSPTQIDQNVSAPKPSVSEPMEIKATVTSDEVLMHSKGTIENPPMDSLPSASEPMDIRTIEIRNDKITETPNDDRTKELLPDPAVTPQVLIHDPEPESQSTRDLLGGKAGYLETVEPSAESSGDKHAEYYLSANLSTEVRSPKDTDLISQGLDTQSKPTIQSQLPVLDLQTFPSVQASEQLDSGGIPSSGDRQPTDATESSKDVEFQAAAGDRV